MKTTLALSEDYLAAVCAYCLFASNNPPEEVGPWEYRPMPAALNDVMRCGLQKVDHVLN